MDERKQQMVNVTKQYEESRSKALNAVAVHLASLGFSRKENDAGVAEVARFLPHTKHWKFTVDGDNIVFVDPASDRTRNFKIVGQNVVSV